MEPGQEECHEKVVVSVVDVPEEVCDLNPVKTCRLATKLVPHLNPTHQCTSVPKEVCVLKFTTPKQVTKPLLSKWCLDTSDPTPARRQKRPGGPWIRTGWKEGAGQRKGQGSGKAEDQV